MKKHRKAPHSNSSGSHVQPAPAPAQLPGNLKPGQKTKHGQVGRSPIGNGHR